MKPRQVSRMETESRQQDKASREGCEQRWARGEVDGNGFKLCVCPDGRWIDTRRLKGSVTAYYSATVII